MLLTNNPADRQILVSRHAHIQTDRQWRKLVLGTSLALALCQLSPKFWLYTVSIDCLFDRFTAAVARVEAFLGHYLPRQIAAGEPWSSGHLYRLVNFYEAGPKRMDL